MAIPAENKVSVISSVSNAEINELYTGLSREELLKIVVNNFANRFSQEEIRDVFIKCGISLITLRQIMRGIYRVNDVKSSEDNIPLKNDTGAKVSLPSGNPTQYIPYQLCPKCQGQGIVGKPPYINDDQTTWSSTSVSFTCDVCNGTKIIPMSIEQKSDGLAK